MAFYLFYFENVNVIRVMFSTNLPSGIYEMACMGALFFSPLVHSCSFVSICVECDEVVTTTSGTGRNERDRECVCMCVCTELRCICVKRAILVKS